MRLSIISFLFLITSCSTLDVQKSARRDPASFSFQSCIKSIGSFLTSIGKSKVEIALANLDNGTLTIKDRDAFREQASQIPFLNEREKFLKEIVASSEVSQANLNLINMYIRQNIKKKNYLQKELYKPRYFGGDENFPLTYGLEFELKITENPNIVNDYRVTTITEEQWLKMTFEDRQNAAIKAQKDARDIDHILVRLSSSDTRLPEGLFIEPHGTLEGNGMVFENMGDFREFLDFYVERFGASSFQAHIVTKSQADMKGMTGYTIFEYEKAQLKTLEKGYARYLIDEKNIPAGNLVHHSLGPIDEGIRKKLIQYEDDINTGEIDFLASGTKSIYAPSFRNNAPYGEGLMGLELRQFHKRYNDMFSSLRELSDELEFSGNLQRYELWSNTEQVSLEKARSILSKAEIDSDLIDDFEIFHLTLGDEITSQIKAQGGARTGAQAQNRLLLPLLDWEKNPIVSMSLTTREAEAIKKAQTNYIRSIMELIKDRDVSVVTAKDLEKVRTYIAKFAYDINLSKHYERFISTTSKRKNNFRYTKLPELDNIFKPLPSENIPRYKYSSSKTETYKNYISNTVEILYRDIGKTGHVEVRVGDKLFSLNNITDITISSSLSRPRGSKGRVYLFDRNKINLLQGRIKEYFESIENNNFPPFDMYGALEKVKAVPRGFKMIDSKNKNLIKVSIVKKDNEEYFSTPYTTVVSKVIKRDGQDYIQTTNCTRVVSDAFKEILDFDFGNYNSASSLDKAFENRTVKLIPDAEIIY